MKDWLLDWPREKVLIFFMAALLISSALLYGPTDPLIVYISGEVLGTSPPKVMIEGYEWVRNQWKPTHFWVDVKDVLPEGYYWIDASIIDRHIWSVETFTPSEIALLEMEPLPTN